MKEVQGRSGDVVRVMVQTPLGAQTVEGSDLLVAAGRVPNTSGIGLEAAGVEVDERGYIRVDAHLATTAPAIWAVGECAGSPQFTHVSADDFRIVLDNLAGGTRSTTARLIPYCMFNDPPLARVGPSEGDAQRQGLRVRGRGSRPSAGWGSRAFSVETGCRRRRGVLGSGGQAPSSGRLAPILFAAGSLILFDEGVVASPGATAGQTVKFPPVLLQRRCHHTGVIRR
ncbi:FAD-dependent oxidoreductase [Bordetella sp. H567]|uniref:FAD-dependent oxidoreductase n=1 Tax=Bordetella sp. H567 TaxID=1697043 RepID=UPI001F2FD31E|nr:FAD-dependent oxidoreductase [Bordetella sp. H567]